MIEKAKDIGLKFLSTLVDLIKTLPGKIWEFLVAVVTKIIEFRANAIAKAKEAATGIFNAVVDNVKKLPEKMASVGKDLVKGLWNGINNMTDWIISKIKSFGDSVLGGIKNFFGIKSPSRVFRDEVGKMLAEGLAIGIEDNAKAPLDAMADLSKDVLGEAGELNGLTLERRMQHTFAPSEEFSLAESGMLSKLDKILAAIERGQILTIDGNTWVGATAGMTDAALGQRRELVARGAI